MLIGMYWFHFIWSKPVDKKWLIQTLGAWFSAYHLSYISYLYLQPFLWKWLVLEKRKRKNKFITRRWVIPKDGFLANLQEGQGKIILDARQGLLLPMDAELSCSRIRILRILLLPSWRKLLEGDTISAAWVIGILQNLEHSSSIAEYCKAERSLVVALTKLGVA